MSKKIILKEFNELNKLSDKFFSMLVFGSRRTGKSELVKYIYNYLDLGEEYDFIVVCSLSPSTLDFFSNFVHGNLFFNYFDENIIENIIRQSTRLEADGTPKKFLCIFDDCIGNNLKNSEAMTKLYATGRHYRISVILIAQKITFVNTSVRNNSDIIFIGKTKSALEKEAVIKNFLDGIADHTEIEKFGYTQNRIFYMDLLKEGTANYKFIVIDNMEEKSTDFDVIVKSIRAKIIKEADAHKAAET